MKLSEGDQNMINQVNSFEQKNKQLQKALSRQCDNMVFMMNNMNMPEQWYDKFTKELKEDRELLDVREKPE